MSLTLRPFASDENAEFFERLEEAGVVTDDQIRTEVNAMCGQHPFLLDVYAYHPLQRVSRGQSLGVEWLRSTMRGTLRDYYQPVITVLPAVKGEQHERQRTVSAEETGSVGRMESGS